MSDALFANKKMYAAKLTTKPNAPYMVKGLESKKRNYPPALRAVLKTVQTLLLHEKYDETRSAIEAFVRRLAREEIPLDDLSISAAYRADTAGRALIRPYTLEKVSRRRGIKFTDGDRIKYIVRERKASEKEFQMGAELDHAKAKKLSPCVPHYFKALRAPLLKLIQFNFDTKSLLTTMARDVDRLQTEIKLKQLFA